MSNHSAWMTMRSMSSDRDIVKRTLGPGLVRRILGYARPYRVIVVALLITLVLGSLLTVAQPLLFRRIIDKGVTVGDSAVVTQTALIIAGIAFVDAGLGLLGRWYSSRIGEGLIYDLRTEASLTQRELAERMGTTQSVISRLEEGGGARNRIDTLARVATALDRHLIVSFPEKVPANLKDAVQVA